ncbi:T9SS type A sorting domain-containing protein [Chitinophaga sp. CF418]|uniref:T9SS type A sorting domain-containing protein n=1 Tax=Chitinophaga sp. CF418 TaxID=1855287 RepID=UPI000922DF8A|nr:T9SS type A sorting domain-containing protein [Chitinophaga sp. CF418]SHN43765.1 Por secretion system C-terminal sorting domain-containing protein [Chitinophaga sp. CF418]
MRKFYMLALMAGSLGLTPQRAQAQTPATWQEHWFEHNQVVSRVFLDNDLALYYDNDVSRSVTWPNSYLSQLWRYTKKIYGSFGTEPQLYAIMHTGKYSGGHPSTYFDASHDFRNVIDAGPGSWTGATPGDYNLLTHEVSHIVEIGGKNMHGSPAFGVWGDSKWAEIFLYDAYKGMGMESRATSLYNELLANRDNFPRANTAWFKDWFYPIYNQYGGAQLLNRYFIQVSLYFQRTGTDYSTMNMGEFVHFWSGAAGVNLKSLATTAFGWTSEYESQFVQAQQKYPFTYTPWGPTAATLFQDINYGGYGVYLQPGSYNLAKLKAFGARNDDVSSIKILPGYKVTFYADDNFTGASKTFTADATTIDASWNDVVSSIVVERSTDNPAPIGQTIWLQGNNGGYMSSKGGVGAMWTNATVVQGWNKFLVADAGNGKVALNNGGLYVSSENGEKSMTCNRTSIQGWEVFDWITNSDGTISLRGNNGMYVSSENGAAEMTCKRTAIDGWEKFSFGITAAAASASTLAAVKEEDLALTTEKGLVIFPNPVLKGNTLTVKLAAYDATAPLNISLVDVNRTAVVYKKANASSVSVSTSNIAGGIYILTVTNGKKYYTRKIVIQ